MAVVLVITGFLVINNAMTTDTSRVNEPEEIISAYKAVDSSTHAIRDDNRATETTTVEAIKEGPSVPDDEPEQSIEAGGSEREHQESEKPAAPQYYLTFFEEEPEDFEWSFKYKEAIQLELYDLLSERETWIEELECKTTLCKMRLSADPSAPSIAKTTVTTLKTIKDSEWHKGALRISKTNRSGSVHTVEIIIGRHRDSLEQLVFKR